MDYDALMAFATFAEHLNFTRAAEELYISQPALHQKVNKLADRLETRLYVRSGRDLLLTEEGRLLARHAREVAAMTEDVLGRIDDERELGPIQLASGAGALFNLLGPAILEVKESPYSLQVLTRSAPDAAAAVAEARAHVAVGVFPEPVDELETRSLREVGQMVVVEEDHRLAGRRQLEPADVAGESLVIAPEGKPHRMSTARVLAAHDVPWNVGVEVMGWELMMRFVRYGMGIAIINDFVPVPDGMEGISISGFPTVTYSSAVRADTHHEGARWLFELLSNIEA